MFSGLSRNQIIIGVILIALILYYVYTRMMNKKNSQPKESQKQNSPMTKTDPPIIFYNFMNPGCGWCEKLAPTWAKLSEKYANNPNVSIRTINSTKPENEQLAFYYNVSSFPTLILVTPEQNIQYVGDRSLGDLDRFVRENIKQ